MQYYAAGGFLFVLTKENLQTIFNFSEKQAENLLAELEEKEEETVDWIESTVELLCGLFPTVVVFNEESCEAPYNLDHDAIALEFSLEQRLDGNKWEKVVKVFGDLEYYHYLMYG